MKTKADNYQVITDAVLAALDNGVVPWRKPWTVDGVGPTNLSTGKAYRGINVLMLGMMPYGSPYWLTYKQAKKMGCQVKKGALGSPIVFWQWLDKTTVAEKAAGEKSGFPMLRRFTVFNVEQIDLKDGVLPDPVEQSEDFDPIANGETIMSEYIDREDGLTLCHGGGRACYFPERDSIKLPEREAFGNPCEYYSTAFHEAGHSTGATGRLNRKGVTDPIKFGSHQYGQEELVAEMTAAFLMGSAGIENPDAFENSVSYIEAWRKRIKEDKKLIIMAAGQAQKAADRVLGIKPEWSTI